MFRISKIFMFLKEVSSAHQGCIYLIKNTEKTAILRNIIAILNSCSLSRELRTASSRGRSRGRYGERRQRDPCLKHTYKNTTCWPATAYDVTTGANPSIKGRRENTSSSSSSSMTVLFEACKSTMEKVKTSFYCYYGEH